MALRLEITPIFTGIVRDMTLLGQNLSIGMMSVTRLERWSNSSK